MMMPTAKNRRVQVIGLAFYLISSVDKFLLVLILLLHYTHLSELTYHVLQLRMYVAMLLILNFQEFFLIFLP